MTLILRLPSLVCLFFHISLSFLTFCPVDNASQGDAGSPPVDAPATAPTEDVSLETGGGTDMVRVNSNRNTVYIYRFLS